MHLNQVLQCLQVVLSKQQGLTADLGLDLNPQGRQIRPVAALSYPVNHLLLHPHCPTPHGFQHNTHFLDVVSVRTASP